MGHPPHSVPAPSGGPHPVQLSGATRCYTPGTDVRLRQSVIPAWYTGALPAAPAVNGRYDKVTRDQSIRREIKIVFHLVSPHKRTVREEKRSKPAVGPGGFHRLPAGRKPGADTGIAAVIPDDAFSAHWYWLSAYTAPRWLSPVHHW